MRRFGNGWWLPAGPMRERASRLSVRRRRYREWRRRPGGRNPMQLAPRLSAVNFTYGERVAMRRN